MCQQIFSDIKFITGSPDNETFEKNMIETMEASK